MKPWFRHYVGMTRDDRLIEAAMRSKQPLDRVVFVWCCILESASECDEGGAFLVAPETIAYQLRVPPARIRAVFDALSASDRIADGRVVQWSSRQFESDTSAARMRKHRESKRRHGDGDTPNGDVTECHSDVTVTDQSRAEQNRTEPSKLGRAGEPTTDAGPGRADDLRSLEVQCRDALAGVDPPRGSFAPIALLVERGADPVEVVTVLRAEAAKPRKTPIASWPGWAKVVEGRLAASRPAPAPPARGSPPSAGPPSPAVFIAVDTPEWDAWGRAGRTNGHPRGYPRHAQEGGQHGWRFPTRWPPGVTPEAVPEPALEPAE